MKTLLAVIFAIMICGLSFAQDKPSEIGNAIEKLLLVQQDGQGNAAAVEAMKTLRSATAADIPKLLVAFDSSNPISANWLRGALSDEMKTL